MDTYEMGPLLQSSTLSGGLFWALALYLPLSGPLQRLEASLGGRAPSLGPGVRPRW